MPEDYASFVSPPQSAEHIFVLYPLSALNTAVVPITNRFEWAIHDLHRMHYMYTIHEHAVRELGCTSPPMIRLDLCRDNQRKTLLYVLCPLFDQSTIVPITNHLAWMIHDLHLTHACAYYAVSEIGCTPPRAYGGA